MKRLLYVATLSLVATLLFAPAALAQTAGPGGEGPCTGTPFEQYIPEVNGCVTTEGQPFPGEAIVYDADTRQPLGTLDEVTAGLEAHTATTEQYTPTAAAEQYTPATPALPVTGGPALLLPAAGLLLATGLVGIKLVRRRS